MSKQKVRVYSIETVGYILKTKYQQKGNYVSMCCYIHRDTQLMIQNTIISLLLERAMTTTIMEYGSTNHFNQSKTIRNASTKVEPF